MFGAFDKPYKICLFFYEKSDTAFSAKAADPPLSIFLLAVFCRILMYTAVEGNRFLNEKGIFIGTLFIKVMPVVIFIIAGFNHCVADTAYFFLGGVKSFTLYLRYNVPAFFGNALGRSVIPLIKNSHKKKIAIRMFPYKVGLCLLYTN